MAYYRGLSSFIRDPGECEEMFCGVCKTKMDVKRNLVGPTSYISKMCGSKHPHDCFLCPLVEEPWHEYVQKVILEIRNVTCVTLRRLMIEDARRALETRTVPEDVEW